MAERPILVTGANGFIGFALIKFLLEKSALIFATCRVAEPKLLRLEAENKNLTIIPNCDLTDISALVMLPKNMDLVVHCMGLAKFEGAKKSELFKANVLATKNLLDYLSELKHKPKRFIYLSSIGVHDRKVFGSSRELLTENSECRPSTYYGETKLLAEKVLQDYPLPFIIARLGWVYGPDMRSDSHIRFFAEHCRKNSLLSKIDFPGRIMATYIDDVCKSIDYLLFVEKPKYKTYLVVGDHPVALGQLFQLVKKVIQIPSSFIIKKKTLKVMLLVSRFFPMKIRTVLEENYLAASNSRLREEGLHLNKPLEDGLRESIKKGGWFDENTA